MAPKAIIFRLYKEFQHINRKKNRQPSEKVDKRLQQELQKNINGQCGYRTFLAYANDHRKAKST